eukprot:scaffold13184_cov101-Isochrysis_galbana.AAC.2
MDAQRVDVRPADKSPAEPPRLPPPLPAPPSPPSAPGVTAAAFTALATPEPSPGVAGKWTPLAPATAAGSEPDASAKRSASAARAPPATARRAGCCAGNAGRRAAPCGAPLKLCQT